MAEKAAKAEAPKPSGKWLDALNLAKKEFAVWETRGEKIVKRYRDERGEADKIKRYNVLWSNIRTLLPAVYAKKPQAQADRRYKDADPVGRTAAQILERSLQYEIDHYPDFDAALKNSVLDRLLPGRGIAWVRYEEVTAEVEQTEEDDQVVKADPKEPAQITDDVEAPKQLQSECSPCDYVFWKDFRHSPARTWEEVTWVARRVYMGKAEGAERFGDAFKSVPMTHEPIGLDDLRKDGTSGNLEEMKKGVVWEIWDKPSRSAIWVADGCQTILDEQLDPLELDGFFPCPKPLYATLSTDTLVPVPDYSEYQDQAREMDDLTQRISMLVKAVKVVGIYDASSEGLKRILNEGTDNVMIPVDTWAMFAEKGGIKGAVDWLPIDMVIQALDSLYQSREACKQVIYEITGMADIIRGSSNPNETLGAQEIKANYAGLRLKETQSDVARFASDLLRIKAQIMCKFYRGETLMEMSGIAGTQDAEYAEKAIKLLKNAPIRSFRIEVASDSMVELDERAEQQSRTEFINASSQFLEKAVPAAQAVPEIAPLLGEMLLFFIRSFRAGRPMEAAFEEAVQKLNAPQQKPVKPTPEEMQAQADQQKLAAQQAADQQEAAARAQEHAAELAQEQQLEQQRIAAEERAAERKQQLDMMKAHMQEEAATSREQMRRLFDTWRTEFEGAIKIEAANIASKAKITDAATIGATTEIVEGLAR